MKENELSQLKKCMRTEEVDELCEKLDLDPDLIIERIVERLEKTKGEESIKNKTEFQLKRVLRLNIAIKDKGYNRVTIEEKTGIDQSTLSNYLNGKREIRVDVLDKLKELLNVSTDYLLGYEKNSLPNIEDRKICDKTKLHENTLKKLKKLDKDSNDIDNMEILNLLFENGVIEDLIKLIISNVQYMTWVALFSDEKVEDILNRYTEYITLETIKELSKNINNTTRDITLGTIDSLKVKNGKLLAQYKLHDRDVATMVNMTNVIEGLRIFNMRTNADIENLIKGGENK